MSSSRLKSRRRQDQGSKLTRVCIAILSTIGIIDTGSITINRWEWVGPISCPGGVEGCDRVLNSAWGTIFENSNISIPLSLIGFISYLFLLILAILPFLPNLNDNRSDITRRTWWGLFLISISMSVFSFILIGVMVYKIKAFCFFCILSALISILIFIFTTFGGGWDSKRDLIFPGILLTLVVFLGGLIWSSALDPNTKQQVIIEKGTPPEVLSESSSSSIALAEHLTSVGATQYSAYWCPHCHDQKELFGKKAAAKLLIVECAPDGKDNKRELCESKGITGFPSWEINGEIESGVKSLKELAELSGYPGREDFN